MSMAILKDGHIKFSINDAGHLIFSYTDEVPVVNDDEETAEEEEEADDE